MTIDSCIIVKNEDATIENLIKQFLEFSNEIHITDTGSTDNTINIIEKIKKNNSNVYLHHFDWCMDFAKARNYSLTCYDCKSDYQFWCDGDDELNEQLVKTLKEFVNSTDKNDDIYFMKYLYSPSSGYTHWRTSLLKVAANLKWNDPIHEYIKYTTNHKVNYEIFDNGSLIIHHKRNSIEHSSRNLEIFMNMEKNNYQFTCRNRFYYARELYYANLNEYSLYQYHKCIDMDENNRLDKINACNKILEIKDPDAPNYFFKLFNNDVYRKDMFYSMGKYYYNNSKLELSRFYYLMCINCEEPKPRLSFGYNKDCHINSLLQLGVIEYKNKNIKASIDYNKQILQINPKHQGALKNIDLLISLQKKNENNKDK